MRGIKRLIGSAMLGVLALAVLYFTAPYTGVYIPVSRLSVAVSAVLGVPGVTLLVLLKMCIRDRCMCCAVFRRSTPWALLSVRSFRILL